MPLSSEQRARYKPIIDGILKASNLDEISAKRIRASLQAAVDEDLTEQKNDVNDLIMERFDIANEKRHAAAVNGNTQPGSDQSESNSQNEDELDQPPEPRPRKKQKTSKAESDAAMAARLQAEENGRARPTRGGTSRNTTRKKGSAIKKSPKKKKSSTKVNSDDDSPGGSDSEKKASKRGGAFNAPWQLSEPLAALTGEQQLSRPQAVKHLWDYIKANGLQHEDDKRQIHCDDRMRAIFNQDNVHMFSMNKILSKHLYPIPGEND